MKKLSLIIIALIAFVQGAWATDYNVSNETELRGAIENGANITLTQDINIGSAITVGNGQIVTINLGGYTLNRGCTSRGSQAIGVFSGGTLYLSNGTVTGGWGGGGGAMFNEGTMHLTSVTISGNTADDRGGGISNNGTLTMTGCTVSGNTSRDTVDPAGGGGIFNYSGKTATLTNCTITGNTASTYGGGGICNYGTMTLENCSVKNNNANTTGGGIFNSTSGTLSINGCDITGNSAVSYGDGIYIDNSTLNMQGLCTVTGNTDSNIYLYGSGTVITVTGAFTSGSNIGVGVTDYGRKLTSGFSTYNSGHEPGEFFSMDNYMYGIGEKDGEAFPGVYYMERSWEGGNTDGHVVSTTKLYTGGRTLNGSSNLSGWYYADRNDTYEDNRISIDGDTHLILLDGMTLTCKKGIHIKPGKTLTIYSQSVGENMGYLKCTGSDGENAAIGGNASEVGGNLVIHGGKIYAKPGSNNSAGIGGGDGSSSGMQSVTIYGGNITAEGKSSGAGIGSGQENSTVPSVTIYGGSITAKGGNYAAGIGGGEECSNGTIKIFGGTVTATGGGKSGSGGGAAGIGSGEESSQNNPIYIYGGTVNATGGQCGAGIGGAYKGNGGSVYVYGGNVTATGGQYGAGIGGGYRYTSTSAGRGGTLTVTGGTVNATGGEYSSGIGGGYKAQGGTVTISNGNVTATGGYSGAGIGGGWAADGGNVTISGGSVTVAAGTGAYAIGRGADRNSGSDGSLTLGNTISVKQSGGSWVNSGSRVSTVRANGTYILQNCTHEGATYSQIDGNDGDYYHHIDCSYCEGENELHTKGDNDECTKCHEGLPQRTYTFYEANAAGTGYGDGTVYYVTETHEFTFPESGESPKYLVFAGWQLSADEPESLVVDNTEGLIAAGSTTNVPALLSSDRNYYARYTEVYFSGGEGTQNDPFLISDADDWNHLAQAVNDGINFNGMYFVMTNDISVSTMVGQGSNRFRGNFDGQGNTITVSYTGITDDYCAPFRHISGATIKNLNTAGTIETSGRYAAGVVAYTRYYSKIQNCRSSVVIRSSHEGWAGHGGILGLKADVSYSNPTIEGCVFDGKILSTGTTEGTKTTGAAGIVGYTNYQTLTIKNCLYKPAALADGETAVTDGSATLYINASGSAGTTVTCTNCYYTATLGTAQGTQGYTVSSGTTNLSLDYGSATTIYEYNGIKVYDCGLLYGDKLYTGGTTSVTFTPDAPAGYAATTVAADYGTLTNNNNGTYTLVMDSTNVSITADIVAAVTRIINPVSNWDSASDGWTFIASPVVADGGISPTAVDGLIGNALGTTPETYDYDLYRLEPSTTMWENYNNSDHHDGFKLVNGKGYLYARRDGTELTFIGDFNNDNTMSVGLSQGWNLVGNPFTTEAYVNTSYYKMNAAGDDIEAVSEYTTNTIPACTGVVIHANSAGSVTFSKEAPSMAAPNNGSLQIALSQVDAGHGTAGTMLDNAIITFNEGSQLGKFIFNENHAKLYIPQGNQDYAIAFSEGQGEMPLNFKATKNGTYTISVSPEGVEMSYLHLIDNMTGADVDLLSGDCGSSPAMTILSYTNTDPEAVIAGMDPRSPAPSYTFTAKTTDYASRFRLVFATQTDADTDADAPFAFISNGNLIVNAGPSTGSGTSILQVIDALGRPLLTKELQTSYLQLPTSSLPSGVYVLRLINGDVIRTQKMVIQTQP